MEILTLSIVIIIGILAFIILAILHHFYNKSIHKINPCLILFLGYLILIINMFLATKAYSTEWIFAYIFKGSFDKLL
ncbi:MAG: hypothetical protein KKE50_06440 [Nanoarchaeota archaeon]|nr:hypothetical protein [Nanoarchaeota archaeon]